MPRLPLSLLFAASLVLGTAAAQDTTVQTYKVTQKVRLNDIPAAAKTVRWWIAIPQDDRFQEVLDLTVTKAPGEWRFAREAEHGNRFLYVEVPSPTAAELETVVDFTVRRRSVNVPVDLGHVGKITDAHRKMFEQELRLDGPHMEVTDEIKKMADQACGAETNVSAEAKKLIEFVASYADHYSKDSSKPKCGIGSAADCMVNKGGCCTDLHSLFIALARSRGIPARLQMGYRLLEKNVDKDVDPGYRCWPEYYVPGYGWVPTDIVEADGAADEAARAVWVNGLSERRVWLDEGRDFVLNPPQAGKPVNTMIIGYAEIDGVPARVLPEGAKQPQLTRSIHFVDVEKTQLHGQSNAQAAAGK
jgi:transglutaminase-like putative cysteine protease